MFGSLKLGKLFGIDLYLHGTFWLLPLFVLFSGISAGDLFGAAFDVVVIFAIFGCVVLHEVGHALAARYYGIGTRDITLYPIGGVASLERMPERPLHEIVVALAGPAVNVVIAMAILAGVVLGNYALPISWDAAGSNLVLAFIGRLFWANVFLVAFNLLPAFPMDGGRVLRALISTGTDRVTATRWAAGVGAVVAGGMVLFALYPPVSFSLLLVGIVVFLIGRAELAAVRVQEARKVWQRRHEDFYTGPVIESEVQQADPFTGWRYDPVRRIWTEWRNGVPVHEVHVV